MIYLSQSTFPNLFTSLVYISIRYNWSFFSNLTATSSDSFLLCSYLTFPTHSLICFHCPSSTWPIPAPVHQPACLLACLYFSLPNSCYSVDLIEVLASHAQELLYLFVSINHWTVPGCLYGVQLGPIPVSPPTVTIPFPKVKLAYLVILESH